MLLDRLKVALALHDEGRSDDAMCVVLHGIAVVVGDKVVKQWCLDRAEELLREHEEEEG